MNLSREYKMGTRITEDSVEQKKPVRKNKGDSLMNRCKSASDFLNPDLKGPSRLDKYMAKRGMVLTQRYGDGGKGFHHMRAMHKSRESLWVDPAILLEEKRKIDEENNAEKRRKRAIIAQIRKERLEREKLRMKLEKEKAQRQSEILKSEQSVVSKGRLPTVSDQVMITEEELNEIEQQYGYSFLSQLPRPLLTIDDILNKTRPTTSAEEELNIRLSDLDNQSARVYIHRSPKSKSRAVTAAEISKPQYVSHNNQSVVSTTHDTQYSRLGGGLANHSSISDANQLRYNTPASFGLSSSHATLPTGRRIPRK